MSVAPHLGEEYALLKSAGRNAATVLLDLNLALETDRPIVAYQLQIKQAREDFENGQAKLNAIINAIRDEMKK